MFSRPSPRSSFFREIFPLLFERGQFRVAPFRLRLVSSRKFSAPSVTWRFLRKFDTRFFQEFLKERVHGLKAVGVASVVSKENVVLQKVKIVFAAVEENQAVLQKFVIGA